MSNTDNSSGSPNFKKYGVPFYAVAWIPDKAIQFITKSQEQQLEPDQTQSNDNFTSCGNYVVLAGGGGEGRSGIPNAVVVAKFDSSSNFLTDEPVAKHVTGSDLPYRMAVHPGGDGLICSFPESCSWFEWNGEKSDKVEKLKSDKVEKLKSDKVEKLCLKQSERELSQLKDVGQQLALAFNNDGSLLAAGGVDGSLRLFKWPGMEIILNEAKAHSSVKDLDFSPDGKFLVSLGSGGPCRVWDVTSSTVVVSLPKENDEIFCACRFSQTNDQNQVLYIAALTGKGGSVLTWDTTTWRRVGSRSVVRDTITAFSVSADGKLFACGTTQGDVFIMNSTNKRIQQVIKKAHLGFVTAMRFSHDSRALASASLDSSARVTLIQEEHHKGKLNLWVILLIIMLAISAYFLRSPQSYMSFIKM